MNPTEPARRSFTAATPTSRTRSSTRDPCPATRPRWSESPRGTTARRSGRLLVLDPALGRPRGEGVVQRSRDAGRGRPGHHDNLVDGVWPQFALLALGEKYFLVSARRTPASSWGVYLVDLFDNWVLIKETPGRAFLEPVPLTKRARPPEIQDRVDPARRDALVHLVDVYEGGGLKGIPRGTVKSLRLIAYHHSYRGMGGLLGSIGMDGPWDIKQVLGTVPVEPDGSAFFRVPASTPISVQPLDTEGKALQLMRSWFTAMPGEVVSCSGWRASEQGRRRDTRARRGRRTSGVARPTPGFNFERGTAVLDRHCAGCRRAGERRASLCDLRGAIESGTGAPRSTAREPFRRREVLRLYAELHRFVRRPVSRRPHLLAPWVPRQRRSSCRCGSATTGHGSTGSRGTARDLDRLIPRHVDGDRRQASEARCGAAPRAASGTRADEDPEAVFRRLSQEGERLRPSLAQPRHRHTWRLSPRVAPAGPSMRRGPAPPAGRRMAANDRDRKQYRDGPVRIRRGELSSWAKPGSPCGRGRRASGGSRENRQAF